MNARKNLRPTANEQRLYVTQPIGCVKLRGPYWSVRRIASASVLLVFAAILCAGAACVDFSAGPSMQTQARPSSEPYDIVLSGSAEETDAGEASAVAKKTKRANRPSFEVTVDGEGDRKTRGGQGKAAQLAEAARTYLRQGDVGSAIVFQHSAVEHAPDNMAYRLQLAVLHDRLSDAKGALMLYRQVVDAYENKDATLPTKLDIDHIKSRLDYLASKADQ